MRHTCESLSVLRLHPMGLACKSHYDTSEHVSRRPVLSFGAAVRGLCQSSLDRTCLGCQAVLQERVPQPLSVFLVGTVLALLSGRAKESRRNESRSLRVQARVCLRGSVCKM